MPAEYKHAKEAFVADNAGTSLWTVNAVSTAGLVGWTPSPQIIIGADSTLEIAPDSRRTRSLALWRAIEGARTA